MSISKDVLEYLICGACCKYLSYFPIYLSYDGMSICGRCSSLLIEEGGYTRNTLYESAVKSSKFPCVFSQGGCAEHLLPEEIPQHEKDCYYRIVSCLNSECVWQSTCNQLLQHYEENHPTFILQNREFEMDFISSYQMFSVFSYQEELFSIERVYDNELRIMSCTVSSYRLTDTKYSYKIIVENGTRNRLYESPPKVIDIINPEKSKIEIPIEAVKVELEDPSIMIGSIKMFEAEEEKLIGKKNNMISYDILSELECPVCLEYITPPIYQCVSGHSFDLACKNSITECPVCKKEIYPSSNVTLEKVTSYLIYPCKNIEYGCEYASGPQKIKEHEKYCKHGARSCPINEYEWCIWKNKTSEMYSHIRNIHHDCLLEVDTVCTFVDLEQEEACCYLLKYAKNLFKLHYRYQNATFSWAMQLIGPPDESSNYWFEIDIIDNVSIKKRMLMRSVCSPFSDKQDAFSQDDRYIFLKLDQVRSFINENLSYRVRIAT